MPTSFRAVSEAYSNKGSEFIFLSKSSVACSSHDPRLGFESSRRLLNDDYRRKVSSDVCNTPNSDRPHSKRSASTPASKAGFWSDEEDRKLRELLYPKLLSRDEIAREFPRRSNGAVKNRGYLILRELALHALLILALSYCFRRGCCY